MQTFLPYPSFIKSAETLDYRRLGKQRVETWQILNTLLENKKAWSNHPAVLMWKGYEASLCVYGEVICNEWIARGYNDIMLNRFISKGNTLEISPKIYYPEWFGNEAFHASHRSNLLRKDSVYYSKFNWSEPNNLEYVWPITKDKVHAF